VSNAATTNAWSPTCGIDAIESSIAILPSAPRSAVTAPMSAPPALSPVESL